MLYTRKLFYLFGTYQKALIARSLIIVLVLSSTLLTSCNENEEIKNESIVGNFRLDSLYSRVMNGPYDYDIWFWSKYPYVGSEYLISKFKDSILDGRWIRYATYFDRFYNGRFPSDYFDSAVYKHFTYTAGNAAHLINNLNVNILSEKHLQEYTKFQLSEFSSVNSQMYLTTYTYDYASFMNKRGLESETYPILINHDTIFYLDNLGQKIKLPNGSEFYDLIRFGTYQGGETISNIMFLESRVNGKEREVATYVKFNLSHQNILDGLSEALDSLNYSEIIDQKIASVNAKKEAHRDSLLDSRRRIYSSYVTHRWSMSSGWIEDSYISGEFEVYFNQGGEGNITVEGEGVHLSLSPQPDYMKSIDPNKNYQGFHILNNSESVKVTHDRMNGLQITAFDTYKIELLGLRRK